MSEWKSEQLIRMAAEAEPMTPERWSRMLADFKRDCVQARADARPGHARKRMAGGIGTKWTPLRSA